MAKYIDSEILLSKIDTLIKVLKENNSPNPIGSFSDSLCAAEIETLDLVKSIIEDM